MCGIAGRLNFDSDRTVERALIERMCEALRHRGPDDQGVHIRGPVGLGHRRLSIIDLSTAGHQPMANDDRSVWIVFNGEIYNFQELRATLEAEGYRFRSRTDTEVLLRLYEREGVDCLRRLRGMFAFAIWDARTRELFLARDRLGVKPLYYHVTSDRICFASEIKALLQDPEVSRQVDPIAVHQFLTYQCVPSPQCAIEGVRKLPPAHYLRCRDGRVAVERYWRLTYGPKHPIRSSQDEHALEEELRVRLEEAVRLRLVSDVPLGAFLSGGIDSSTIVALMSRLAPGSVRTFSIGFDEKAYDESAAARLVAERFGTRHVEFHLRPDALEIVPQLVRAYDEPYADASAIPTYYVSKLAREHVTVALNGDGGDECFAGYDRYIANDLARRLGPLAALMGSEPVRGLVRRLSHGPDSSDPVWRLKRFVEQLGRPPEERHGAWMSQFEPHYKRQLYSDEFASLTRGIDPLDLLRARYREAGTEDALDAALAADVTLYLPEVLLVKVDIASMANSLEARSPFLDHVFMEFAARLPARLKLHGGQSKVLLKRAFRGILPDEILRRPKMGFNVPVDLWLRRELRDMAYDVLLSPRSRQRGYFRPEFVQRLLDEHTAGTSNWHSQIWSLLMLECWHREFVDSAGSRPALLSGAERSAAPEIGSMAAVAGGARS